MLKLDAEQTKNDEEHDKIKEQINVIDNDIAKVEDALKKQL
jgi:archaellum component FlaC